MRATYTNPIHMLKRKLKIALIVLMIILIASIALLFGNELIGRWALSRKTTADLITVPSNVCSTLSHELCRATENCRAIIAGNTRLAVEYGFDYCEAIPEDTLADYQEIINLCQTTGGTITIEPDTKRPNCSCGSAAREEFFATGSREFGERFYLGCTTAKQICDEFYQGTWIASTITNTAVINNETESSCRTYLTGNTDPVQVWNSTTQQCEVYTYEPRFPECYNNNGNRVSHVGGF